MEVLLPHSLDEALAIKAEHLEAVPLSGGTDLMVELNFGRARPPAIVDLNRVGELTAWREENGNVFLGSGVTYTTIVREMQAYKPLVQASRSVGSPQIRNRGTVGGNLGTASPAGDVHPPLLAADAQVELASATGTRRVPVREFFTGPKQTTMRKDELIAAFLVEPAAGPQQFSKVGTRNAMVIAVCSFALALDPARRRVGTGIGSAGPTPLRATEAERFIEGVLEEDNLWDRRTDVSESAVTRFGELVALAAKPIDDVRGTAAYRRHALSVLARRCFTWAWAAA